MNTIPAHRMTGTTTLTARQIQELLKNYPAGHIDEDVYIFQTGHIAERINK